MQNRAFVAALIVSAAGLAPHALGQVARPDVYVWSSGGRPYTGTTTPPDPSDYLVAPNLKQIVRPYFENTTTPAAAAAWVADDVLKHLGSTGPDHISSGEFVLSFSTFGRDIFWTGGSIAHNDQPPWAGGLDCDSADARDLAHVQDFIGGNWTSPVDGAFYESPLRFFTKDDALGVPWTIPSGSTVDEQFFVGSDSSSLFRPVSSRTYRNPVNLHNANTDPNNVPPLKKWMIDFCDEYAAIRAGPTSRPSFWATHSWNGGANQPPVPVQFHMDTEVAGAWEFDSDSLTMLYRLGRSAIDHPASNPSDFALYNFWSNHAYEVPGTGGKTMSELYGEVPMVTYDEWPIDITDSSRGMSLTEGPNSDRNRPFMIWYAGVCRKAYDAVLKNCFYDVVEDKWPGCKTSNYDMGNTDGEVDDTGWYMDSNGTKHLNNGLVVYPDRISSHQLIRSWAETFSQTGGAPWHESSGLWSNFPSTTSARKSAPVTYRIGANNQWHTYFYDGVSGFEYGQTDTVVGGPALCDQQPNLYYGPSATDDYGTMILETIDETSMRLFRHEIESCIDSFGGEHESDVVPWMALAGNTLSTPKYSRDTLSMFRSHKIQEIIGFTGANVDHEENPSNPTDTPGRQTAIREWTDTQAIMDQVYSPYIASYSLAHGQIPDLYSWDVEPSRLEYVTRASAPAPDALPSVDMLSTLNDDGVQETSLEVVFRGLANSTEGYFSTIRTDNVRPRPILANVAYGYVVHIECLAAPLYGSDTNGQYGTIEVFDWASESWKSVRIVDSVQDDVYQRTGPRWLDSDGITYPFKSEDKSMRLAVDIRSPLNSSGEPTQQFVLPEDTTLDSVQYVRGTMRLRLNHIANNPDSTILSSYDLVQVAPFPYVVPLSTGGGSPTGIALGDPMLATDDLASAAGGRNYPHVSTPFDYEPVDLESWPHAPEYYSNPIVPKFSPTASWEPSYLDTVTCTPIHYSDWHYHVEGPTNLGNLGQWPTDYNADEEIIPDTRLLTSRFNLEADVTDTEGKVVERKQKATARFTLPVWTNAPAEGETGGDLAVQPYQVWYWITRTVQWANITAGVDVQISRDPNNLNREVVISSRTSEPFQAGYYALTLNLTPPTGSVPDPEAGEQYAVYCSGTLESPGTTLRSNASLLKWDDNLEDWVSVPIIQYNFRIYPDCDKDGLLDSWEAQCNFSNGTNCGADVDDGSGTGTTDGGVDVNDLIFFLAKFELGDSAADLDNGTGIGMPDQAVDINDLLFFLAHFELGC